MSWNELIFSEKQSYCLRRHCMFWFLWWAYFTVSYFHYEQSGVNHIEFEPLNIYFLIKSFLLLSIHIATCYYFINYLLPKYLLKARYVELTGQILILSLLILISNYFVHKTILPFINDLLHYQPSFIDQNVWWTSISSGLLSAPKVICAAAAIKLLKRWWLKQKEKEKLEEEKVITDLQLLKTQMHPEFLFSSLNCISALAQKKDTNKASTSLLKLADILSYMLYESDNELVIVEKEIATMRDYVLLEKTKIGQRLDTDLLVKGDTGSKMIAPLLLLPFIENSFSYLGSKKLKRAWMNLQFHIESAGLTMKLIHGKNEGAELQYSNGKSMANTIKRLDFLYAGKYELKTRVEPDIMMTSLRIVLKDTKDMEPKISRKQMIYATG